ncbi:hypothetical protein DV515_00008683 [Chloebia gouldiae]|uniref:Uncharacterized protein n=1 Tax=Chloebia gouldiae TaxID=44316 RepID=A0A3L8SFY8_CHLGU|nr:hypothetical protein DV515_00008683 [Chloebia gouldiae]
MLHTRDRSAQTSAAFIYLMLLNGKKYPVKGFNTLRMHNDISHKHRNPGGWKESGSVPSAEQHPLLQVAAFHTPKSQRHIAQDVGYIPKGFSEAQCPAAAPGAPGQQGTAGNGSLAQTLGAGGSYKSPDEFSQAAFPWSCGSLEERACTSSSSRCSKCTGQVWDVDCVGCPAALGACASSSFFTVSTGGKAGQSHFFLRVLQVICREQREEGHVLPAPYGTGHIPVLLSPRTHIQ